jgi:hypothetical protein
MNVQPSPRVASDATEHPMAFQKRFLRKPVNIRVEVERFQQGLESASVNMSPSGICLELDEPLEDGERCRVLLYIPHGKEVEILKVSARMVWQQMQPETGKWRVGAAFLQFAPGDAKRIRQWLLALTPAPAEPEPQA